MDFERMVRDWEVGFWLARHPHLRDREFLAGRRKRSDGVQFLETDHSVDILLWRIA
jgi:hypothetical protein